jgi:hypothetical protein
METTGVIAGCISELSQCRYRRGIMSVDGWPLGLELLYRLQTINRLCIFGYRPSFFHAVHLA